MPNPLGFLTHTYHKPTPTSKLMAALESNLRGRIDQGLAFTHDTEIDGHPAEILKAEAEGVRVTLTRLLNHPDEGFFLRNPGQFAGKYGPTSHKSLFRDAAFEFDETEGLKLMRRIEDDQESSQDFLDLFQADYEMQRFYKTETVTSGFAYNNTFTVNLINLPPLDELFRMTLLSAHFGLYRHKISLIANAVKLPARLIGEILKGEDRGKIILKKEGGEQITLDATYIPGTMTRGCQETPAIIPELLAAKYPDFFSRNS